MKLYKIVVLLLLSSCSIFSQPKQIKILHLSFHQGCINDFAEVAHALLNLDLTSWYILENAESRTRFAGEPTGNAIYNISAERASRIWRLNKEYFDTFDMIITSDTAPLARIFLQHEWHKPLLIWVCNRFDYYDGATANGSFPDAAYYNLMRQAITQENVKFISYTPYEYFYAKRRKVDFGNFTIKPLGALPQPKSNDFISQIPLSIVKEETFFIPPRLTEEQKNYLLKMCSSKGIKAYCGNYNGPDDLAEFKGVIHFPYAWSNLALFENIQRGLIHFVPSISFVKELIMQRLPVKYFDLTNTQLAEWYLSKNAPLFVYFDSWDDLVYKIKTTDYAHKSQAIKEFATKHHSTMLSLWQSVFDHFDSTDQTK